MSHHYCTEETKGPPAMYSDHVQHYRAACGHSIYVTAVSSNGSNTWQHTDCKSCQRTAAWKRAKWEELLHHA